MDLDIDINIDRHTTAGIKMAVSESVFPLPFLIKLRTVWPGTRDEEAVSLASQWE
jgi:hypothetical protein